MNLTDLAKQVHACTKCPLRADCTQPVPGLGEPDAKYFILGENPGREEDKLGVPFVGLSGKRLNKLLVLAGIDPNECFITNVVKCKTPQNRIPRKAERLACYHWLQEEFRIIKPKTIITLGASPLSLFTSEGVKSLHGTQFEAEIDIDD